MKILFTCIGRRVELAQLLKEASVRKGINLTIIGTDLSDTAPALYYCDKQYIVPRITDKKYIPKLLKICEKEKVDCVIPTIDTDLILLAEYKDKFEGLGTKVLISSKDMIEISSDKMLTSDFFVRCGLKSPIPVDDYLEYSQGYPAFIKPKNGSSSINAYKVHSFNELEEYALRIEDYIVQPFIDGEEYTVDVMCDFIGSPIYITPRKRLAVRSGEVLKTQIVLDKQIISETKEILKEFKPCGPITIQLIRKKNTKEDFFIEINPRFGGGAPISMKSGANSMEVLLDLLCNKKIKINNEIMNKAVFSRFDQSVYVPNSSTQKQLKGIIFDLDDTLFQEIAYVMSGFKEIERYLNIDGVFEKLMIYFQNNEPAIDILLEELNLQEEKEACLNVYRNHFPNISIDPIMKDFIENCKKNGIKVGIITDGRVDGQKNKIKALGLEEIVDDIIITDELGGPQFRKPCDIAFRIMQRKWLIPFEQMAYIGDNLNKDFQAPMQLGMNVYLVEFGGLYSQDRNTEDKYIDIPSYYRCFTMLFK